MNNELSLQEDLDFAYLLELMPPLHNEPEFAWLPELFSIIGHKRLITLCKYAGGETIKIPKIDELLNSIEALQHFYNIYIKHTESIHQAPSHLHSLIMKIERQYNAKHNIWLHSYTTFNKFWTILRTLHLNDARYNSRRRGE